MPADRSNRHRVYVFDLGGVCYAFEHERRLTALADVCGLPSDEVFRRLWGSGFIEECNRGRYTAAEAFAWARGALGLSISYRSFGRLWSSAFTPRPAVLDLVERLHKSHKTAMLTDNGPVMRDNLMTFLPEVYGRFDQLLFSCDLHAVKPETKIFMAATQRLGVRPEDITLIDDVPEYAAAAESFGWRAVVYTGHEDLAKRLGAA